MIEEEVPREDWKAWIVNRVNADEAAKIDAKPFHKPYATLICRNINHKITSVWSFDARFFIFIWK